MFTEDEVRIMLEKMFSEGRRYESAKYQPQSFSEAVKYYSDKIISAQKTFAPDVCHGTADGRHLLQNDSNGRYCFACGIRR